MSESRRKGFWALVAASVLLAAGCSEVPVSPLEEVFDFGSNPGELRMLKYVPDSLYGDRSQRYSVSSMETHEVREGRDVPGEMVPLVVALHGCMQNATEYADNAGWVRLADRQGFLLLLPEQRRSNNLARCFSWYSPEDHGRDVGEALSIRQMVERMLGDYPVDPQRIYVTGISAGAAMTLALAAVYADVFAGAAPLAGIPYGCADGMFSGLSCMRSPPEREADEWAAAVRAASSHTGPWPRISVWQGGADKAVNPANGAAVASQWVRVHGVALDAAEKDHSEGYRHTLYLSPDREVLVETHEIEEMGHGVPVNPGQGEDQCGKEGEFFPDVDICSSKRIASFWGLDRSGSTSARPGVSSGP